MLGSGHFSQETDRVDLALSQQSEPSIVLVFIEALDSLQVSILFDQIVIESKLSVRVWVAHVQRERKYAFGVVGFEERLAI